MPQTYSCVPNGVPPTQHVNNTGAGTPVLSYPIGFPYISSTDIIVFTGNTGKWTQRAQGTGANQYQVNPKGGLATDNVVFNGAVSGTNILIWRRTDLCDMSREFQPGSSIRAQDLNQDFTQLLYLMQEAAAIVNNVLDGGDGGGGLPNPGDKIELDDLGDVDVAGATDRSYLAYDGTNWVDADVLKSTDSWASNDSAIATTAAGDARWLNSNAGDVNGGPGIDIDSSTTPGQITISADLTANGGLEFSGTGNAQTIRVDAGNGIVVNSTGVNVGAGTGITVNTNDVAVTSQTIWGQAHDHSGPVSGNMTSVGDITFAAGGGTLNGAADEDIVIAAGGTGEFEINRDVDLNGDLDVSGTFSTTNLDLSGNLNVDGNSSFGSSGTNTHEFDGDLTILRQGDIRFNGNAASNAGSARFQSPNQYFDSGGLTPTNFAYTLPSVAPPGDRVLQSDSSGVMSWVAQSSGGGGAIQSLSNSPTTGNVSVNISDGGTNTVIAAANTTQAGVMTSGMFDKLNGLPGDSAGVVNLGDLDDVTITSVADGQVIRWVDADSQWQNQNLFGNDTVLNFRGVVDMRTNNPNIAYGDITAGDFWVHDDPAETDPADVVGTAQQDAAVPSGWTRVNNPGSGSESVNTTGLPVARGTMVVAGQRWTISGTDILNFVQLGTINAGTITDVTASNGLTATDTGTTTNISMDTTGVTAGDYGSASAVPVLSVNDRGQITSATTAAIPANTNTEYSISVDQTGGNNTDPNLTLSGTDSSTDSIQFEGGTNVTVTRVNDNRISISASGGGSGTITEVATNNGLQGGATSGKATVGIANNGVTTARLANNAVTYAKMQDMAANTILGNNTGSTADPKALTVAQAQTLLQITPNATTNTGTVTSVATNNGLTGGTITGSGTIGIANNGVTATQLNVSGNGTSGQALLSDGDGSFSWGDAGSSVTIQDGAPGSPSAGDLWWNSSDGRLYVYYNDGGTSQWVDASPEGFSYSNADVDTHLNTATATANQILSWTGTDYDWVNQNSGGSTTQEAYVVYDSVANAIRLSGNIDSVTKNGTGFFTLNFTTNISNANYGVIGGGVNRQVTGNANAACYGIAPVSSGTSWTPNIKTTSACQVEQYHNGGNSRQDSFTNTFIIVT